MVAARDRMTLTLLLLLSLSPAPTSLVASQQQPPTPTTPPTSTTPTPTSEPAASSASEAVAFERKPYAIRCWLKIDPAARVDARRRGEWIAAWRSLARRTVGAPWKLEVQPDEGPLAGVKRIEELALETLAQPALGADQAWLLQVSPNNDSSILQLSARNYDVDTGRLGPVVSRRAAYAADMPREWMSLGLEVFQPSARVVESGAGGVTLSVQAAALAPASPLGQVVKVGSVFRPSRIFQKPDGSTLQVAEIRWTYLVVESLNGPLARCQIVSSYSDPLSRRVARRSRLVAQGVKPVESPTRLRFLAANDRSPLAGYSLEAQRLDGGSPFPLGLTDREGGIVVPVRFSEGLVRLRLLAGEIESLAEFPVMPGETADQRTLLVDPKPLAVEMLTKLEALDDELLDLIARRSRYEAILKARIEADKWDEVEPWLKAVQDLPGKAVYQGRVKQLRDEATRRQAESKAVVMTRAVLAKLQDLDSMVERYLDDEAIKAYATDLAARKATTNKKAPTPVAPNPGSATAS